MISSHERVRLVHIMKMNRSTLAEADTGRLIFNEQTTGGDYAVSVLVIEDAPTFLLEAI